MREIKFRFWDALDEKMLNDIDIEEYTLHALRDFEGEILQYTGLKDKNGVEIYEGDWCSAEFRTKDGIQVVQGKIIVDEFMWCIDCIGCVGGDLFSVNRLHNFTVIGNIFQNPELLEISK